MVIRRTGVGSAATVFGALYALMGLLIGLLFALFSFVGAGFAAGAGDPDMPAWFGTVFGVGAVVILPILYGIMGVITGAVGAAFYNLIAGMFGGLRLETQ